MAKYDSFEMTRMGQECDDMMKMFSAPCVARDAGSSDALDFEPDSIERMVGILPQRIDEIRCDTDSELLAFFRAIIGKDRRIVVEGNHIRAFGCSGWYHWEVA